MPEELIDLLRKVFTDTKTTIGPGATLLIGLALAMVAYVVVRYLLLGILLRRFNSSQNRRFKYVTAAWIPHLLTLLVPWVVLYALLPSFSPESAIFSIAFFSRLLAIYLVLVVTLLFNASLNAVGHYYHSLESSRVFPINSILDVARAILFVLTAVVLVSILFSIPAVYILAAVGAVIATGTVVFNNLILALVSGLILTSKRMIMIGDWIELPELRINGEVQEITLTTVIVRNQDHTIGTVPSAYLLAHSFKNWRGVLEAGARQIFWPLYIDINSVKPAGEGLLAEIASLPHGAEILSWKGEVEPSRGGARSIPGSPSSCTNLGLFREYCIHYLQNHPRMVAHRLLTVYFDAPTKFGIPMQVMVSTGETDYERFLGVQSSVLEDLLQLAGEFGLEVFQIENGAGSKSIRRLVKEPDS